MAIVWIAMGRWWSIGLQLNWIGLDWIGLETRRGIVGEIRSRAEIRISQMPTMAGRHFFLEVFKS